MTTPISSALRAGPRCAGTCLCEPQDLLEEGPGCWWVVRLGQRDLARYRSLLGSVGIAHCHFIEHVDVHRPGKGWRRRDRALLGGYLFAADCARDDLLFEGLTCSVLTVPDSQEMTAALRDLAALLGSKVGRPLVRPQLQAGQRVHIDTGTFAGIDGTIVDRRGDCDLLVTLPVLGSEVLVVLPADTAASL